MLLSSSPIFWSSLRSLGCSQWVGCPAEGTDITHVHDTKEIQSLLAGSLLLMRSHAMLKDLLSSITFTVTKNILNSILNSIDNWDDIEKKCNPFESIPISKSGAFLLTMMCMKPKIIVYFLQQLKNYLINSAKDIKTWVACYVIVGSMLVKFVQPQCPPIGVVVRRGEVPGQVSSLDQGSELSCPSPIALIYTAGQLLRTDNTIIHSNHKMKGSKMWKIRISAGYYKRNRRTAAQQVANQFLAASGKQISRKTVARRLRGGGGLYALRPVVGVPLTRQHRTARLQWCREHHNWTEQDWACVLFSDESRFSLSSDCRRQLIWRESGTAYRPENIQEKDRYPTCSIMVWAGIMINGRTRLHVVANGTMTGQRYIDEVLLPHVRLFRGAVGDKFVFMDDNATCHRTLAVQDCLDSEGIQRLVWPARSPDLNPIENVWDALGRQVAGRNYPPTNKNTLIRALTEEWDKLPQQLLDNVVQTISQTISKEIHCLVNKMEDLLLEHHSLKDIDTNLPPPDASKSVKETEKELSFEEHCQYEYKKLKDLLLQKANVK
ncbi:transposable element Tcb2 transposase [Trichonephila clavipes]|nr:transposable element Tcb2 transposase [Trichonephila clavipes]